MPCACPIWSSVFLGTVLEPGSVSTATPPLPPTFAARYAIRRKLLDLLQEEREVESPNRNHEAWLCLELGVNYLSTEELDTVEDYLEMALDLSRCEPSCDCAQSSLSWDRCLQKTTHMLGLLWTLRCNYDKAIAFLSESESVFNRDSVLYTNTLFLWSQVLNQKREFGEAARRLQMAMLSPGDMRANACHWVRNCLKLATLHSCAGNIMGVLVALEAATTIKNNSNNSSEDLNALMAEVCMQRGKVLAQQALRGVYKEDHGCMIWAGKYVDVSELQPWGFEEDPFMVTMDQGQIEGLKALMMTNEMKRDIIVRAAMDDLVTALQYFTFEEWASDHVRIQLTMSGLRKISETDKMQRLEALLPLIRELNPKVFTDLYPRLCLEVADGMMELGRCGNISWLIAAEGHLQSYLRHVDVAGDGCDDQQVAVLQSKVYAMRCIRDIKEQLLKRCIWTQLLPELMIMVFSCLSAKELGTALCVCREWKVLIDSSDVLWRNMCIQYRVGRPWKNKTCDKAAFVKGYRSLLSLQREASKLIEESTMRLNAVQQILEEQRLAQEAMLREKLRIRRLHRLQQQQEQQEQQQQ